MTKEQYYLTKLMEECAEVTKEASKCIIFGVTDEYKGVMNRGKLEQEIIDLIGVYEVLVDLNILPHHSASTFKRIEDKKEKLAKWLKYSQEKGQVDAD